MVLEAAGAQGFPRCYRGGVVSGQVATDEVGGLGVFETGDGPFLIIAVAPEDDIVIGGDPAVAGIERTGAGVAGGSGTERGVLGRVMVSFSVRAVWSWALFSEQALEFVVEILEPGQGHVVFTAVAIFEVGEFATGLFPGVEEFADG